MRTAASLRSDIGNSDTRTRTAYLLLGTSSVGLCPQSDGHKLRFQRSKSHWLAPERLAWLWNPLLEIWSKGVLGCGMAVFFP